MAQFSEYRQVWVAENSDGMPIQSALDPRRIRIKRASGIVRYVPVDAVIDIYNKLRDGDSEGALKTVRLVLRREELEP